MRWGRLAKVLWTAALLPLFLAAVLPDHIRTLVCRFSGAAMDADCCPAQSDEGVETQARLRDESCCFIRTAELTRALSDRQAETTVIRRYELGTKASATSVSISVSGVAPIRRVAPPALGPPIVLLKRSFLI